MWLFLVSKAIILIIVKLQGGLGNQMFQYAIARSLATRYATGYALDHHFLESREPQATHVFRNYDLDIFTLQAPKATAAQIANFFPSPSIANRLRKLSLLRRYHFIIEPHFHYYPEVFERSKHCYLDGYWQSEKYFQPVAEELRTAFRFSLPILPASQELLQQLQLSGSVCLNVRRSDFVTNTFHTLCSMRYYRHAMELIRGRVANARFFVFSDDKDWCRQQFAGEAGVEVVGEEHNGFKYGNFLQLMSACRHFIIPASSYGWWAVWLANRNDNIVIAPDRWFSYPDWDIRDLMPDRWIKLSPD
jgi:hypothetical protein